MDSETRTPRELAALAVAAKASALWAGFDRNERTGVRFGMFPAVKMGEAEREISAAHPQQREVGRLLAVALMDCAKADGGMRA